MEPFATARQYMSINYRFSHVLMLHFFGCLNIFLHENDEISSILSARMYIHCSNIHLCKCS